MLNSCFGTFFFCTNMSAGTEWVLGHGHALESVLKHLSKGGRDPKLILDDLIRDDAGKSLPAIVMEETSHSMWVNSEALRRAGINSSVPDPPGGIIMRNDKGEPNGKRFHYSKLFRHSTRA